MQLCTLLVVILASICLSSCGTTYPSKAYGRAFVTEAYKQGFYSRSTYDWEMDRIARMRIPDGEPHTQTSMSNKVQATFGGLAHRVPSASASVSPVPETPNAPTHGSGETPSASFANQTFAAKIAKESGGALRLVSFQKTDGTSSVVFGTKHYEMEGQLTFAAVVDTNWTGASIFADAPVSFGTTRASPQHSSLDGARMFAMNETYLAAGSTRSLALRLYFIRTERGWKLRHITRSSQ